MNHLTRKCVETIKQTTDISKEALIIVDQEVKDACEKWEDIKGFAEVGVVRSIGVNVGVPKGYNEGIKLALQLNPKYIVILNNDVELLEGCIQEMIRCAESNPKIGIVGGKSLTPHENPLNPSHGGIVVFKDGDIVGKPIDVPEGAPPLNLDIETYCVGFACALIKAELFGTVGLFDEKYSPCDYEDTDYCFAARQAGWKVISCVPARYIHLEGATMKTKKINLGPIFDRNRIYFAQKWKDML